MAQPIEEQLKIMQAYAEGQPAYCREEFRDIGKKVEETGHQFDFKHSHYSLTPMDWCTGKEAIDAYDTFMRHGYEGNPPPTDYGVTLSVEDRLTNNTKEFWKKVMDVVDTFSIFMAGAEWILRNGDSGIDFRKSLQDMRKQGELRQAEQNAKAESALYGH